jgi:hypothetical protein
MSGISTSARKGPFGKGVAVIKVADHHQNSLERQRANLIQVPTAVGQKEGEQAYIGPNGGPMGLCPEDLMDVALPRQSFRVPALHGFGPSAPVHDI